MREIKYRVWFPVEKRMDDLYKYRKRYGQKVVINNEWYVDEVKLMQYTGLKDKDGVEVYEGDIVRAKMDFGPAGYVVRTSVIKYDCINGYKWQYYNLNSIEVIGNIYENPELIQ